MSETQAPYLDSQNDFGEHGHFTTHSDPGDMAPATANPARLGDATLPAALLGEATERPRMMVGRWPLDHRRANVALPDDREGELLDRLAAAEARAEAAEADNARLRAALTLASGLEDYSSHNHGCGVLKAWSVRMTAGEYACTCGLSDAYRTIRAALAATPADSLARLQRLEAVAAAGQALVDWWDGPPYVQDVSQSLGDWMAEIDKMAGEVQDGLRAALAATPADSRERWQAMEAVVVAGKALVATWSLPLLRSTPHWLTQEIEQERALTEALARLDGGGA